MHYIARKMTVALAVALGAGFAIYTGSLYSHSHARMVARSGQVMYLGTITVTPEDAPGSGERYAQNTPRGRYAGRGGATRGDRREVRANDEAWPRV